MAAFIQKGPIKNVIFDVSEVLITGVMATGIALSEKHKMKLPLCPAGWTPTPLVHNIIPFFHGESTEDEYISGVVSAYPELGTKEWLKSHIRQNFKEVEGMRPIVKKLKAEGYSLALLSVHAKEWVEYCEGKFGYHELFDFHFYSYKEKVAKPKAKAKAKTKKN